MSAYANLRKSQRPKRQQCGPFVRSCALPPEAVAVAAAAAAAAAAALGLVDTLAFGLVENFQAQRRERSAKLRLMGASSAKLNYIGNIF